MHDVAQAAGVSHQTVSRVLNDHPHVRQETRDKVHAAIMALGYRRNSVARALVTQRTGAIGVVTEDSPLHGPTMTLMAIETAARREGMYVSVATVTRWDLKAVGGALEHFIEQGVDGVVVIASHDAAVQAVQAHPIAAPVVMVGPSDVDGDVFAVAVDQGAGARTAVRHLIELGHRDIAHVTGPAVWLDARSRERGWRDALLQAGLEPRGPIVGDWTASTGYRIGRELIDGAAGGEALPTAVFAANDQLALGLLHAFAEGRVSVPGDVSVVGYDDVEGAGHFFPPLTSVAPDFSELGRLCLQQVITAMAGESARTALAGTALRVRSSTGPPRPGA